ncbi:hypothetical protein MT418_006951 [Batrachochytrium dendrobatidis]
MRNIQDTDGTKRINTTNCTATRQSKRLPLNQHHHTQQPLKTAVSSITTQHNATYQPTVKLDSATNTIQTKPFLSLSTERDLNSSSSLSQQQQHDRIPHTLQAGEQLSLLHQDLLSQDTLNSADDSQSSVLVALSPVLVSCEATSPSLFISTQERSNRAVSPSTACFRTQSPLATAPIDNPISTNHPNAELDSSNTSNMETFMESTQSTIEYVECSLSNNSMPLGQIHIPNESSLNSLENANLAVDYVTLIPDTQPSATLEWSQMQTQPLDIPFSLDTESQLADIDALRQPPAEPISLHDIMLEAHVVSTCSSVETDDLHTACSLDATSITGDSLAPEAIHELQSMTGSYLPRHTLDQSLNIISPSPLIEICIDGKSSVRGVSELETASLLQSQKTLMASTTLSQRRLLKTAREENILPLNSPTVTTRRQSVDRDVTQGIENQREKTNTVFKSPQHTNAQRKSSQSFGLGCLDSQSRHYGYLSCSQPMTGISQEIADTQPLGSFDTNLPCLDENDDDIGELRLTLHQNTLNKQLSLTTTESFIHSIKTDDTSFGLNSCTMSSNPNQHALESDQYRISRISTPECVDEPHILDSSKTVSCAQPSLFLHASTLQEPATSRVELKDVAGLALHDTKPVLPIVISPFKARLSVHETGSNFESSNDPVVMDNNATEKISYSTECAETMIALLGSDVTIADISHDIVPALKSIQVPTRKSQRLRGRSNIASDQVQPIKLKMPESELPCPLPIPFGKTDHAQKPDDGAREIKNDAGCTQNVSVDCTTKSTIFSRKKQAFQMHGNHLNNGDKANATTQDVLYTCTQCEATATTCQRKGLNETNYLCDDCKMRCTLNEINTCAMDTSGLETNTGIGFVADTALMPVSNQPIKSAQSDQTTCNKTMIKKQDLLEFESTETDASLDHGADTGTDVCQEPRKLRSKRRKVTIAAHDSSVDTTPFKASSRCTPKQRASKKSCYVSPRMPFPNSTSTPQRQLQFYLQDQSYLFLQYQRGDHVWALWNDVYYPAMINERLGKSNRYMILYLKDASTELLDIDRLRPLDIAIGDACHTVGKKGELRLKVARVCQIVDPFKTYKISLDAKHEAKCVPLNTMTTTAMLIAKNACKREVNGGLPNLFDTREVVKDACKVESMSEQLNFEHNMFAGFGFLVSFSRLHTASTFTVRSNATTNPDGHHQVCTSFASSVSGFTTDVDLHQRHHAASHDILCIDRKESIIFELQKAGGLVYDDFSTLFDGHQPTKTCPAAVVLVAQRPTRSKKFIMAVALGIPIVSTMWVQACMNQGSLVDFADYRLSNGESLEMGHWCVLAPSPKGVFQSIKLFIYSKDKSKTTEIKSIIQSADAHIVSHQAFRLDQPIDYIVCVSKPTQEDVLTLLNRSNAPVVTLEWVFQCIINQRLLDVQSHSRYHCWE